MIRNECISQQRDDEEEKTHFYEHSFISMSQKMCRKRSSRRMKICHKIYFNARVITRRRVTLFALPSIVK